MSYAMRVTGRGCFSEMPPPLSCFVGVGGGLEGFSLPTSGCDTDGGVLVGSSAGSGCPHLSQLYCSAWVGGGSEVFSLFVTCGCCTDGGVFVGLSEV